MTVWQLLTVTWHWHPSVVLGFTGLIAAYFAAVRFRFSTGVLWYVAGIGVLLITLLGPLHELGETYLFSAHMLQHLLLLLIVPPLLLLGLPGVAIQRILRYPPLQTSEALLRRPSVAWATGIGVMWLWHLPVLYTAALRHESIHILEHLCFLAAAVIFWWPILAPVPETRLPALLAITYLFTAMLASNLLGILLTFAPVGLYPTYLDPADPLRILPLLRGAWGLTPAIDQELGGLLMSMPGNLVYLVAIIMTLIRWYGLPEEAVVPKLSADQRPQATMAPALEDV